jgi:hypothetical protein
MKQKKNKKKHTIYTAAALFIIYLYYTFGPGCPQQAFLGISCPGCGMTRAYLELLHGNIRGAFFYHPAFFLIPLAALILFFHKKLPKPIFKIGITLILLLFITIYLYRLLHHDPVLTTNIKNGYIYKFWKTLYNNL